MARRARSNAAQLALKRACLRPRCKSWCQPAGRGRIADFGAGRGRRACAGARWRQISLADIVEAVEGPIALTLASKGSAMDCAPGLGCSVRPHWPVVNEALRLALSGFP
jgi:hypothetical protein